MERKTHTIDAKGQTLGRLATRIATLLQGKHKVEYVPNQDQGDIVEVTNAALIKVTGKKLVQKEYKHFSGYPGGLKSVQLSVLLAKEPARVLWLAVHRMLPKNRLRPEMIKRLIIR